MILVNFETVLSSVTNFPPKRTKYCEEMEHKFDDLLFTSDLLFLIYFHLILINKRFYNFFFNILSDTF